MTSEQAKKKYGEVTYNTTVNMAREGWGASSIAADSFSEVLGKPLTTNQVDAILNADETLARD